MHDKNETKNMNQRFLSTVSTFGMVLILEHLLGLNDLCHISKSRLWGLYFCPEGLELELLQTGTRAQIEDSE